MKLRSMVALLCGGALALTGSPLAALAQVDPLAAVRQSLPADPEDAERALRELLWRTVAEAGAAEVMLASSLNQPDSAEAGAQDRLLEETVTARRLLTALLDTIVLKTEWGKEELERLRRRYPASALFLRYQAELAGREGDFEAALAIHDRLLGMRPADAGVQILRARTLEALGRTDQAIAAYTRALDIAPEDENAFRALVRLRRQNGTLPALLEQVRRLRTLYPDRPGLAERETEIIHRLGSAGDVGGTDHQPYEVMR